jgi:hypothetical protein
MQDEKWKNERKMKNVRIYETIALLIGGCILVLAIRFLGLKLWLPVTLVGILLLYSLDKVAVQTYKMLDGKKCNLVKHERLVKLLAALMGVFLANGSLLYMAAFYSTTQNYFGVGTDGYSAYYWFGEYFMRSILSSRYQITHLRSVHLLSPLHHDPDTESCDAACSGILPSTSPNRRVGQPEPTLHLLRHEQPLVALGKRHPQSERRFRYHHLCGAHTGE